jgi:iron complex outermembrane recepter protein
MSKTTNMRNDRKSLRWQLLVTVSAAALLAAAYGASEAEAAGNSDDRPLLWIEFGGQLSRLSDMQDALDPSFMATIAQRNLLSALNVQSPPAYALDTEGKISFQPDDTDWVVSASIRYGRSAATRHRHQQTANATIPVHISYPSFGVYLTTPKYPNQHVRFADGSTAQSERHAILDFQAGKDIGIGMFGSHASSVLSAGVRFAQFSSKRTVDLHAEPDVQYPTAPENSIAAFLAFRYAPIRFHDDNAIASSQRDFRGVGPSLSWDASIPLAGHSDSGELAFDLGANAAILFGRQKARGHHQTTVLSYYKNYWESHGGAGHLHRGHFVNTAIHYATPSHYTHGDIPHHTNAASFNRTRSVTVPNFGGFAGISYRYSDAKLSLGYRADFFFGAIDGGIDTRKTENRAFYGPYASISIGLGD